MATHAHNQTIVLTPSLRSGTLRWLRQLRRSTSSKRCLHRRRLPRRRLPCRAAVASVGAAFDGHAAAVVFSGGEVPGVALLSQ